MAVLDAGILRLRDTSGRVVGAGFLVGAGEILTCSHVVERALGHQNAGPLPPTAAVTVDFPLVAPDVALTARVVRWQPVQDDGDDVAGLRLQGPAPAGARALRLLTASELWGHPFRTFGFPSRHDDGVWASGRLLERQATGWVQLEDVKTTGFRVEPGFSGAPVWDDELGGVVGMAVAAEARPEVRAAFMIPANVLVTAWPELERQTLPPCPYRGLYAFREEDHELFFGREELERQLFEQLSHQPVVGVIGPSGSGKSSLVFAGAVPRLRQRFVAPPGMPQPRQRPEWVVAAMRPAAGASPLAALAWALLPMLEPEMTETRRLREVRSLEAVLAEGRLAEVADRVRQRAHAERLLLVIDQFEELYGQDQTTTREFIDLLAQALGTQPEGRRPNLVMALTLRADFLGHTLEHPVLAEALQGRVLLIGRMTRQQLRQVIEGPAADQVSFEAGLVERILDDVGTEPGNLPLLEFSLTLLWELQTDRLLTHAAYESLGGVDGALARYAEQVYADELATPEREEARRLLVQLVRPGEATEHTRRVARRSELDEARWHAAQHLATTRLVVTGRDERGDDTVEVVHEALIAGWGRLREWVQADREFRVWQERLRGALAEWRRTGNDEGMLLRGVALAEAERWLEQRPVDISSPERDFIAASRARQHRGVRRLRAVAATLAGLLVLVLGLGAFALVQGRRAEAQSRRAISLYLLARSEGQPDLAIALSLAAHRLWPTDQTRASLLVQLDRRRDVSAMLTGHTAGLRALVYSRDGRTLASAGSDNTIRLWDPSRRAPARVLAHPSVSSIAFTPDGRTIASAGDDASIRLWDVESGTGLGVLTGRPVGTRTVAFSPDGRTLAAGNDDDTVVLWDVAVRRPSTIGRVAGVRQVAFSPDGRTLAAAGDRDPRIRRWRLPARSPLPALGGHSDGVQAIAFSPDGRRLASAGVPEDGTIRLWVLTPRPRSHPLNNDEAVIDTSALAFSPDGRTLASGADYARLIWLWDVAGGARVGALTGHTDTVTALAYSPDGRTLASGSMDRTVALFDLTVPTLSGHTGSVTNVVFSRDGSMLASAGDDTRIILWDAARRTRLRVLHGHSAAVTRVAFSPDSRMLASTGEDGRVLLWDLDRRTPPREVPGPPEAQGRLAFSPVGRLLALPGDDGSVALWDLDRGISRTLTGHDGPVRSVAFSPDGATVASGGEDKKVILWDVASGARVGPLAGHTGGVDSVAFSPDGATLASAGGNVLLWDVARHSQVATLGLGISVAFRPDGRMLAVGTAAQPPDFNSSVILWDLAERVPYATLERGIGATFSPDGRTLATGGQDIVLRNLDAASWQGRLCQMVGREMTRAEWADHIPGRRYQTVCH